MTGSAHELEALASRLVEKQIEVNTLEAKLSRIIGSAPWRALALLWRLRLRLAPPGTTRDLVLKAAAKSAKALAQPRRLLSALGRRRISVPVHTDPHEAYQQWIATREPDQAQLSLQSRIAARMTFRPLITVITPVFNPPPDILQETIQSVLSQTYDNWELILVDGASDRPGVSEVLGEFAAGDQRIHLIHLDRNHGISENTNRGLAKAEGEFVAFLDHDDLLAPDALFEVTRLLNVDPSVDIVYSDEDKLSEDGRVRSDPFFKPSWSPEYLLSTNYLMHSVIRRSAVAAIGGLDPTMDGAQDWDLALRLMERDCRTAHIPKVLYHWRRVKGSVAADARAKMWAMEVQDRCLQAHLERRGFEDVRVESPTLGVLRLGWKLGNSRVSVIIPSKDNVDLLSKCLDSVFRAARSLGHYEVILVDTGSEDARTLDYYAELHETGKVRILNWSGEFNYHAVNNFGARSASGNLLVFLNNDVESSQADWLEELVRWAEIPEIGCVGAKLLFPDNTVQHAGIILGLQGHGSHIFRTGPGEHRWGVFGTIQSYRNYRAVTGACLAVRKEVFDEVGGFDEAYELCYGDIDLCLRVAARGYRNMVNPFAEMIHHEGGTRGLHFPRGDVLRASLAMFPLVIQGDPFFSPNLSYDSLVPATVPDDEPLTRGARILSITQTFQVREDFEAALDRELTDETREWSRYRSLLAPLVPPQAVSPGISAGPSDPLRVLVVLHDLSRSGAPMVCLHLVRYLCGRGHTVTIASPKDGRLRENFEETGASVVVDPLLVGAPEAASDCIRAHDVVVANTILTWRTVLAARACDRGVLWYIHESKFGHQFVRQHTSAVRALALADTVAFPSLETAQVYRDFAGGNHKVIHYGFDKPNVSGQAFQRKPEKIYVLTVASIEARKGQDILVEAVGLLPEEVAGNVEFLLIGRVLEREYFDKVRRAAARLGNIRFVGEVPPENVLLYFNTVDIAMCSSRDDPSPVVVLEAMGLGKAVVSTRVGAMPELIEDGVSGLLVEKEDPHALASALTRLYKDRLLLDQLGRNARARFDEELTLERFGQDMETELRRLADRNPVNMPS